MFLACLQRLLIVLAVELFQQLEFAKRLTPDAPFQLFLSTQSFSLDESLGLSVDS